MMRWLPKVGRKEKKELSLKNEKIKEQICAYVFIAPLAIGLLLFEIGPIFYSFYLAFTDYDGLTSPGWVGLGNFARMLRDASVPREIANTLIYVCIAVPIGVALATFLAVLVNRKLKFRPFYRSALFLPTVILPVVIGLIWKWMFSTQFGVINQILESFGIETLNWLTVRPLTLGVVIAMGVWTFVGYDMVIILSGLQNIPRSYIEAAKVDGANSVQTFFKVTLPMLSPTLFFVLTIELINGFKLFDQIMIFAGGHTGDAQIADNIRTLVYGIYESGFRYMEMGYASAKALVLFVIILLITLIQFIGQRKWVNYDT